MSALRSLTGVKQPLVDNVPRSSDGTGLSLTPASPPFAQGGRPNNAPAVTAAATHPDRGRLLDHEPEDATPRFHHAPRRRGRVAARGACAAGKQVADYRFSRG